MNLLVAILAAMNLNPVLPAVHCGDAYFTTGIALTDKSAIYRIDSVVHRGSTIGYQYTTVAGDRFFGGRWDLPLQIAKQIYGKSADVANIRAGGVIKQVRALPRDVREKRCVEVALPR